MDPLFAGHLDRKRLESKGHGHGCHGKKHPTYAVFILSFYHGWSSVFWHWNLPPIGPKSHQDPIFLNLYGPSEASLHSQNPLHRHLDVFQGASPLATWKGAGECSRPAPARCLRGAPWPKKTLVILRVMFRNSNHSKMVWLCFQAISTRSGAPGPRTIVELEKREQ